MDDYGRRIILDIPFEQAVKEATKAFRAEGFDVVSSFDVRDYLKHLMHHDCRRYVLLEALSSPFTLEALRHDPGIGPLLTTTIAVYELADGETAVSANPALAPVAFDFGWRAGRPEIAALADQASARVARAFERLHPFGTLAGVRVPT